MNTIVVNCRNLCSILPPPPLFRVLLCLGFNFRVLLGLGFNFCPLPLQTTGTMAINETSERFRKDMYTKMFFAGITNDDWTNSKRLFIRSDWAPDTTLIPVEFRARVSQFLLRLQHKFKKRRPVLTNLTPYQTKLLEGLRVSDDYIVLPTDKNLGPAIIERSAYTKRAFDDHLNDETTYSRLTQEAANARILALRKEIEEFIENEEFRLPKDERTYLTRARFFTADAVSMYTNIDTDHALLVISNFLRSSHFCRDIAADPIIRALEIIMRNNMFKFGDTHWLQITGTAMGTPPACMYAILYYGIHELSFVPRFRETVPCYKRFIDDVFGIWIMDDDPDTDERNWTAFKEAMPFGKLTWEFSQRTTSVDFLDLTLTLDHQRIVTRLYEKPLNLYMYIPPHSAHPPGILRGMITGYITRVFRLTSTKSDCEASIRNFYRRLCARGYTPSRLLPLFHDALKRAQTRRCEPCDDQEKRIYLHLQDMVSVPAPFFPGQRAT